MVMLALIMAGTMTVTEIVFVMTMIIKETTILMLNTDTNTDSSGSRRNST